MIYRFTQGVRALVSFSQPVDYAAAEVYLTPEMLATFKRLRRSEQQHSLRVLRDVLEQEPDTPHDLAIAALMHDSGKVRYPLSVAEKSIAVLVGMFWPKLYTRLADGDPEAPWAKPFVVAECHPRWSGEILHAAGASERAKWLAAHHGEPVACWMDHPYAPLLWRLQRADDSN